MLVTRLSLLALSLSLTTAACLSDGATDEGGTWDEANAKADDPNADGVTATQVESIRLLNGFDKLLDQSAGDCVQPLGGQLAYTVGSVNKPYDVYVVSSRDDLAKKVGVDMDLKIKFGSVSAAPTMQFVDSFEQTKSSVNLLIAARASYRVTNTKGVTLTDDAYNWLQNDQRQFLHRCGNFYVNGVEHEAQLFVLIHFDLNTTDANRTISGDLGLQGVAAGPVNLDGNLRASLATVAKRADVTVATHVLDRGFLVDGGTGALMGSLLSGEITADTFTKIDQVRTAMLTSIQGDMCRDGGNQGGNCSGGTTGYADNSTRYAVPVRVDLRAYSRAMNAPLGGAGSPYQAMRQLIEPADQYLRTLSRASARIDAIEHDEIAPFLAASADRKAMFGIAPPAAPVYSVDALVATATRYEAQLDETRTAIDDLSAACWNSALEGALEDCAPPANTRTADLDAMKSVDTWIADYAAHARIVPVQYKSVGVKFYGQTHDACATNAMRLPTLDESRRLALPMLLAPTVERSTDTSLKFTAWHSDVATCANNGNKPGLVATSGAATCLQSGFLYEPSVSTLCVPSQGPFSGLRAL